ncbi:class I SAM-dependent methyltransferase [filamentous cyanobacterium LEGE 11480]|uniref:Class I SAM-dependent methyltransferase n=1 Tax=Romeriopsis navalis LEGE 11480 TaxID=2777977 RepID=A0A928VTX5_9CYAN|nr:class I SAM-dependent methyltransferase [Romeriopsis navalis]MBE9032530.1 class I SAM-dependent methyltransferase [Romeriopsis navalis LEGE 11480]
MTLLQSSQTHIPLEQMNCPICQAPTTRQFQKATFWIRGCTSCQHQFLETHTNAEHVDAVYGDEYFDGGGAGYPGYLAESGLIRAHGRRYAKLLSKYMPTGCMLDVGAAAGFVLQGFVQSGWQGTGVEPNDRMASYGRECLGLDIRTGSFEQVEANDTYDLVNMVQVIPHFWNLNQALETASQATKPGGYWLIETWNRESRLAKFFGTNWHEYSPPSVLRWFSPSDLALLASQYGFREVDRGQPQKWISGAHVKSLVSHKLKTMGILRHCRILLKLVPDKLRIPYPSEDLFWALYQKDDGVKLDSPHETRS